MARYRIVCTLQEPCGVDHHRAHIVSVGTGMAEKADTKWSLGEVLSAMASGDVFYTKSRSTGLEAKVEPFTCGSCRRTYIRSKPDEVTDNNLDDLRRCNWQ